RGDRAAVERGWQPCTLVLRDGAAEPGRPAVAEPGGGLRHLRLPARRELPGAREGEGRRPAGVRAVDRGGAGAHDGGRGARARGGGGRAPLREPTTSAGSDRRGGAGGVPGMTLWLRLRAPFAAFRWMQAGVYRATSPVIPPSAAWGLVLNLAGVETRGEDDGTTTQIRADAPPLCLAIGAVHEP